MHCCLFIFNEYDRKQHKSDALIIRCIEKYAGNQGITLDGEIAIHRDKGKPYTNAMGIEFSVSHSQNIWACAVAQNPLGLDVQHRNECEYEKIAKRFFHVAEYEYLKKNKFAQFHKIWAAKESYVKYTGQGITQGLSSFSVVGRTPNVQLTWLDIVEGADICLCTKDAVQPEIVHIAGYPQG